MAKREAGHVIGVGDTGDEFMLDVIVSGKGEPRQRFPDPGTPGWEEIVQGELSLAAAAQAESEVDFWSRVAREQIPLQFVRSRHETGGAPELRSGWNWVSFNPATRQFNKHNLERAQEASEPEPEPKAHDNLVEGYDPETKPHAPVGTVELEMPSASEKITQLAKMLAGAVKAEHRVVVADVDEPVVAKGVVVVSRRDLEEAWVEALAFLLDIG